MFQLVTMRIGSIVKMAKSAALSTMSSKSSALLGDVCVLSATRGAPSGSTQIPKAFDALLFPPARSRLLVSPTHRNPPHIRRGGHLGGLASSGPPAGGAVRERKSRDQHFC